ncbi:beta-lactamase/transpeptidase-like protein [Pholiota conissans]|uniref:Beta-lactamase/transpeptidase-like protein n=1 Tax=Pholiota conissans TaxID=109636 RepID=A0A9P5YSW0_9AGAR|nr:beta-lactamase/transpeptidase-like protein [Pholiota conissans]
MVVLSPCGKESLDALLAKVSDEGKVSGFVFGVTSADGEIYFNGRGHHIIDDPTSSEMSPDSVFAICSQTKLITHIAALKLLEQGLLDPETPAAQYIPELTNPVIVEDEFAEPVTCRPASNIIKIRHLLNSTSGMFYPMKGASPNKQLDAYAAPHSKFNPVSEFLSLIQECLGDLPGIPLKFEPGTDFTYGWGSDILGFVIEKVTGQNLETFLYAHLFYPLGMKTSFYLTPELKSRFVLLTLRREGKLTPWDGIPILGERDPANVTRHLGGTGLYSSLKDYLTLLRHLLQIYAEKAVNPICSKRIVEDLFKPTLNAAGVKSFSRMMEQMDPFSAPNGYQWSNATALCTADWPRRRKAGTAFWMGWLGTHHFMDPMSGVAAVFGTQILPTLEHEELSLIARLEETLYAALLPG